MSERCMKIDHYLYKLESDHKQMLTITNKIHDDATKCLDYIHLTLSERDIKNNDNFNSVDRNLSMILDTNVNEVYNVPPTLRHNLDVTLRAAFINDTIY